MGFGAQTQLADFEVVRLMDGGKWSQEGEYRAFTIYQLH